MAEKIFNCSQLAELFGLDRRTVTKRVKDTEPAGNVRGGSPGYRIVDVAHLLVADRVELGDEETAEQLRRRKLRAEAGMAELELASRERAMLPRSDVDAAVVGAFSRVRQRLLAIPSKLAPILATKMEPAEVEAEVRRAIHDALEELASTDVAALVTQAEDDAA